MASFELPIIKPAVTLGTVNTLISHSAVLAAIGLYNSDPVNDIVVTPKDGNGKIIGAQSIPAGKTRWIDFAQVCKGKGFYFDRGVFISAATAAKVDCWLAGYEETNIVVPFVVEIVKPALTLGLSNVMVNKNILVSGIGLYNSHNAVVTVTPKDANGRTLAPVAIDPGDTEYLDFANISTGNGFTGVAHPAGFYFAGGLTLLADVADKVDAWVAGYTQS